MRKKKKQISANPKEVKNKNQCHRDSIIIVSNLNSTWYFTEYQNLLYTATVKSSHKPTTQEKPASAALAKIIFQRKVQSSVSFSHSLPGTLSAAHRDGAAQPPLLAAALTHSTLEGHILEN